MEHEMTVGDFADMHEISQPIANAVIAFLVSQGIVTKTDKTRRKNGSTQGRASALFLVPETATMSLIKTTEVVTSETTDMEAATA
jgi:hypothetical protein